MNEKFRILVVDDEAKILDVLVAYLKNDHYEVFTATSGSEALDRFKEKDPHMILLDLMLPDISGEEVCRRLRQISNVPIIMLTAKTHESSILDGFHCGADDYIIKPFRVNQLMARVKALLKRTYNPFKEESYKEDYDDGFLSVSFSKMEVKVGSKEISITPKEFKILTALMKYKTKIFTREELISLIYDDVYEGYDRIIDAHVKNLRHKIEKADGDAKYIQTVYGVGYRFRGRPPLA